MINRTLAQSYLLKAVKRLKVLTLLLDEEAYSDVVREAQELVELALKGVLREIGVEPPKQHDIGSLVVEFNTRLPREVAGRPRSWPRSPNGCARSGSSPFTVMWTSSPPRNTVVRMPSERSGTPSS